MKRYIISGAVAALAVIGLALPASAASAGARQPGTVTITTNSFGHMDTTNVANNATLPSPNGPVWAIDSLHETWTIVACSQAPACDGTDGADYYVTLTTPNSHFVEFANPGPNDPADGITSTCPVPGPNGGGRDAVGQISGTISYSVVANAGPDLSSVASVQPPNTGLGAVLSQIFDNATNFSTVGATPYDFKYTHVCGSTYEQTG